MELRANMAAAVATHHLRDVLIRLLTAQEFVDFMMYSGLDLPT